MKSGSKSGQFVKGVRDPRAGRGPAKGAPNAGRPPDEFKEFLKSIRDSEKFRQRLQDIANLSDPMTFMKLASWIVERTDGKPMQEIQTSGEVTVRVVYD